MAYIVYDEPMEFWIDSYTLCPVNVLVPAKDRSNEYKIEYIGFTQGKSFERAKMADIRPIPPPIELPDNPLDWIVDSPSRKYLRMGFIKDVSVKTTGKKTQTTYKIESLEDKKKTVTVSKAPRLHLDFFLNGDQQLWIPRGQH